MSRLTLFIHDVLPRLEWRWFGVGALQAYLSEGGRTEQRVHIWHPELVRKGIRGFGDAHDHRFSFTSKVLCGQLYNTHLKVALDDFGSHDMYEISNARKNFVTSGTHDAAHRLLGRASVSRAGHEVVAVGQEYEFPRGAFHETLFGGVTVSLITKFDQKANVAARLLCPAGEPLVHAFGGEQPWPTERVLTDAREALMRVIA